LAACDNPVTGEPDRYGVSLSVTEPYAFPAASQGYTAVEALTVTVTNTGNRATGGLTAALSGTDAGSFTVTGSPIGDIPAGGTGTFTVVPKTGLTTAGGTAKTYAATVTVSGGNGITAGFGLSFTVYPQPAYGISLDKAGTHALPGVNVGYPAVAPLTVTVTNTGTGATGELTAVLSGADAESFTVTGSPIADIQAGGAAVFTVGPVEGLTAAEGTEKTYTAAVTVSGDNGITAGFNLSFTVYPEGIEPVPVYGIVLDINGTYAFPESGLEYAAEPLVVTVINTGNRATGGLTVAFSGEAAESFTLSGSSLESIPAGGTGTFTVVPKTGLAAGTYTETITVSGGNGIGAGFNLSFTVEPFFASVTAAADYLTKADGGTTADSPVPLPVKLDDGDWAALFEAINTAGKYVALDLSVCGMAGTEFDPGTANTGEKYIASLVLPDAAESTKDAYSGSPLFRYFTSLKEVSGANVKTIGSYAFFYCTGLTSVSFPEVTAIGDSAFSGCTGLTSVSFPEVTAIGDSAFRGCTGLTSVSFPEVTSIGNYAFYGCTGLTAVNLPASLTSIGSNPFIGCTNLTTITVDSYNPQFTAKDGMLLNKAGTTVIAYLGASGTVTLSDITTIGVGAFANCTGLTSVSFPEATSIGGAAFYNCNSLTTVSFPKVTYIGEYVFSYTGGIALTITLGDTPPTVGYGMFSDVYRSKTVTVKVPSSAESSYDTTWQDAFKGKGNDGGGTGTVNTNITLTIEGYEENS
jgi:hypothetical protein